MISISDTQKMGIGILGFGITFLMLGILLVFDRGLLAMGNILFMLGLALLNGMTKFLRLILQRDRWYGSLAFVGGIVIVLSGWCFLGIVMELGGFFLLFWDFFPIAISYVQRLPMVGYLLELTGISQVLNWMFPARRRQISED
eukprot:CFRG0689T1